MTKISWMSAPPGISDDDLAGIRDPAVLLERAWELEPWGRYAERTAVLDALESLLDADQLTPSPGRQWRIELHAERSIDFGRTRHLDEVCALADQVVGSAGPDHEIAIARVPAGQHASPRRAVQLRRRAG
jgi:hypothetical protein